MQKKYDIIGIGTPGLDFVVELERLPRNVVSSKMQDCCFQGGGWFATALCAAGNLGMRTSFMGMIGNDVFGKMIEDDFKYNKVDTSHLIVKDGVRSNLCLCLTESSTKSKTIISRPGECREVDFCDLDEEYLKSTRMLHVGFVNDGIAYAADIVRANGGKVSVDAAYYQPYIYNYYSHFDIFIGSEYFFNGLCDELGKESYGKLSSEEIYEVIRHVRSKGPETVIFTFGSDGCKGIYQDKCFEQPAMEVPVVDTTGAGDCFHGAFDTAYLMGMGVEEAARFATGVSSIKCTALGGRAGIPDLEMLNRFLESGEIDYEKLNKRVEHYKRGI